MEADLERFYHRDLGDLWRFDSRGRRLLTLRQVYVRIKGLPPESLLAMEANTGRRPWGAVEFLLADLWELTANRGLKKGRKPARHPARPVSSKAKSPEARQRHDTAMRKHRRQFQRHYAALGVGAH